MKTLTRNLHYFLFSLAAILLSLSLKLGLEMLLPKYCSVLQYHTYSKLSTDSTIGQMELNLEFDIVTRNDRHDPETHRNGIWKKGCQ